MHVHAEASVQPPQGLAGAVPLLVVWWQVEMVVVVG